MLAILLAVLLGQAPTQTLPGTWVAEHAGTRFIRLELRAAGDTLGGSIAIGNLRITPQGEIESVTEVPAASTVIFDVVVKNSVLTFARKDQHDTDRFEVRLVGNAAELHFILTEADRRELAAEGVPPPRPVRLTKIAQ
jgi:hypothetical protein